MKHFVIVVILVIISTLLVKTGLDTAACCRWKPARRLGRSTACSTCISG